MRRPRLYPNHPHQWSDLDPTGFPMPASLVRCTVCGFEAPRNIAGLDGHMSTPLRDEPDFVHVWQPQPEQERPA